VVKTLFESKFTLPVLAITLIALGWVLYFVRTNWFFASDDYGAFEYVTKFSWWGLIWRAFTIGDPWGFNKFLGYFAIKFLLGVLGVSIGGWMFSMFLGNLANFLLMFWLTYSATKSRLWGGVSALILSRFYLDWVSNLHELVAGFFVLISSILWLSYIRKNDSRLAVVIGVFYLLALSAKEMSVSLPIFLLGVGLSIYGWGDLGRILKRVFAVSWGVILVLYFYLRRVIFLANVPGEHTYLFKFDSLQIRDALSFYTGIWFGGLKNVGVAFLPILGFLRIRFLPLLLAVFVSLVPTLILTNRREIYYMYIPTIYLAFWIGFVGHRLECWLKRRLVFPPVLWQVGLALLVIVLFGGRKVFPKFARVEFPNYQKEEVVGFIQSVDKKIQDRPQNIALDVPSVVGRDLRMLLDSRTMELFSQSPWGEEYKYTVIWRENKLLINKK
jgi:hypothetical protein